MPSTVRDIDAAAAKAALPLQGTKTDAALGWFATLGDQPQLRVLCVSTIAAGLVRRDHRLARAGLHMLVAHEAATAAKTVVKSLVDRRRPRSLDSTDPEELKVKPGGNPAKEESSFPSGHSAGAAAVARAFSRSYPEHRTGSYAAAGAVALVQIPRCAHYPSDVGAGLAIGVVAEALTERLLRRAPFTGAAKRAQPIDGIGRLRDSPEQPTSARPPSG